MKLKFYNCPAPKKFDKKIISEIPSFISYEPDFKLISKLKNKYKKFENILIVGHGGSINSLVGIYYGLRYQADKKIFFLNTIDPDYIHWLKSNLKPKNTLVIAISKSGENITQLEAVNQFLNYPLLFITEVGTPFHKMALKLNAEVVIHPNIGGRYTGMTEVALLPAGIAGIDVQKIYSGAVEFYHNFQKDNSAWDAASVLFQLEQKGYVDVFMPIYSKNLFPLSNAIIQLCHESFGKAKKGQTYFAHEAPESQHHTNQRFFGGRKNIMGFFIGVEKFLHDCVNKYPANIQSISIKGKTFGDISGIDLGRTMQFELLGTLNDAKSQGIPVAWLSIESFGPEEIGRLIAFWQLYAVYGSLLRKVNPYDQPQVEASKKLSFSERLKAK